MEAQSRQVAYKMRIGDLLKGNVILDGERFSALEAKNKRISRVNLISNVVDSYSNPDKGYHSITIDDGTGQIQVKGFSDTSYLLSGINVGDTVRVVGFVRQYNSELYVIPEIVKKVDQKWAHVRKLELVKEYGVEKAAATEETFGNQKISGAPKTGKFSSEAEEELIESEKIEEVEAGPKTIILKKIKDNPEGIDIEKIIMEVTLPVNQINETISLLIAEGAIYEPKPGYLKSLD